MRKLTLTIFMMFVLNSNFASASQSAIDYLSEQGVSMLDFGVYKLSEFFRQNMRDLGADYDAKVRGTAFIDEENERLVFSANMRSIGKFSSGKDACSQIIDGTRKSFLIKDGKPGLGMDISYMSSFFEFAGGGQTSRGMQVLRSLEKTVAIQCLVLDPQNAYGAWGKLLSTKLHRGLYTD